MGNTQILTDGQQTVIDDVKTDHYCYGATRLDAIQLAFVSYTAHYYREELLSDAEFYQVIIVLMEWALEHERPVK